MVRWYMYWKFDVAKLHSLRNTNLSSHRWYMRVISPKLGQNFVVEIDFVVCF